jgi:hypothetical protein
MIAFLLVKVNTGEEAIYSQREKKKIIPTNISMGLYTESEE